MNILNLNSNRYKYPIDLFVLICTTQSPKPSQAKPNLIGNCVVTAVLYMNKGLSSLSPINPYDLCVNIFDIDNGRSFIGIYEIFIAYGVYVTRGISSNKHSGEINQTHSISKLWEYGIISFPILYRQGIVGQTA